LCLFKFITFNIGGDELSENDKYEEVGRFTLAVAIYLYALS